MLVAFQDILEAQRRIGGHVRRTPVIEVDPADFGLFWGGRLSFKLESLQHTGSFKARGAFNTLLSDLSGRPAVAVSGGNHGAAVAYAASKLGREATIFVPEFAPARKVEKIRSYGLDLQISGVTIAETMAAYRSYLAETGALDIHPYDAAETIAGQGTVGLEWAEQSPGMDAVLVAIGGGGLISGVAAAMAGGPEVIGVEPEGAACAAAARKAGEPVEESPVSFAKDSLGAPALGPRTFAMIEAHVETLVTVPDEAIRAAQAALWRQLSVAAEPGGATAFAALLSGAVRPEPGAHVGVLICGANFDPATLSG